MQKWRPGVMKQLSIILLLMTLISSQLYARDFRRMIKIPVAPKGYTAQQALLSTNRASFQQIDRTLIEASIKKIVASWNNNSLSKYLVDNFQDKSLLLNTIRRSVPRDARLRVLSVQAVSTLEQKKIRVKNYKKKKRQSVVIATVELQLEFNDPFKGFVRLPHTSQFYLQVTESE